jgi:hypothetical protein
MNLTNEQVEQFQNLYKKRFGKDISKEHAYEQGIMLLQLMGAVYKPVTKNDYEKANKYKDLNNGNAGNI